MSIGASRWHRFGPVKCRTGVGFLLNSNRHSWLRLSATPSALSPAFGLRRPPVDRYIGHFVVCAYSVGTAVRKGKGRLGFRILALGSKNTDWPYPSAQWVRQTERRVELDSRLTAFLAGMAKPSWLSINASAEDEVAWHEHETQLVSRQFSTKGLNAWRPAVEARETRALRSVNRRLADSQG